MAAVLQKRTEDRSLTCVLTYPHVVILARSFHILTERYAM